jgi:hypothetical protein
MNLKNTFSALLIGAISMASVLCANASSEIHIKNRIGTQITVFKVVNSDNKLVASGTNLNNNSSQLISLKTSGRYTIYIKYNNASGTTYAKGAPMYIPDDVEAEWELQKIITSTPGSGTNTVNTISREAFEQI